jgi:predicted nicotinamide N-methyase
MADVRYRFHTMEFASTDIHLRTLRDRQQFHDPDGTTEAMGVSPASWPLFGVVWAAGEVLAHLMDNYDLRGKRVLEVGCGIGLASLIMNQQQVNITACDYHPDAGDFLAYNTRLNNCRDIPFFRSNWSNQSSEYGLFDLVVGSDLLYEPNHAGLLSGFIDQHAARSSKVIIVDPGRGNIPAFCQKMTTFGFDSNRSIAATSVRLTQPFSGHLLEFSRSAAR